MAKSFFVSEKLRVTNDVSHARKNNEYQMKFIFFSEIRKHDKMEFFYDFFYERNKSLLKKIL